MKRLYVEMADDAKVCITEEGYLIPVGCRLKFEEIARKVDSVPLPDNWKQWTFEAVRTGR